MPTSKLLDSVSIERPCTASWDEMVGNDQVRVCRHCELSVNDLSAITRAQAEKLVRRSKGKLCLRIFRDPAGEVVTRDRMPPLYTISRRASRIAAGAFTAIMSMSTAAYPQTLTTSNKDESRPVTGSTVSLSPAGTSGWLKITALDQNGAVIPGATVTVTNEQSAETHASTTDENGISHTWLSGDFSYNVKVSSPGFANFERGNVALRLADETLLDIVLSVGGVMGDIAIVETFQQPMVRAVRSDDMDEVNKLLREGVNVDQAEDDGTTALYVAVNREEYEMVLRLLRARANANALKENGDNILFSLDDEDDVEMIELLLHAGANVNQVNVDGDTPLIKFAEWDDDERVQVYVEAGAKIDWQNKLGFTALMVAAHQGNADTVKALLKAGANPNLRNNDGDTALSLAVAEDEDEVADLLRAAGAVGRR
ncbi:MAG: ankyrin repeat domain-containing protein [Pyrinomonadaceae bacterium]